MNNLKRVLSLGLVGAMLSGMMIMGASAATNYTDAEDIVNVEAVEVMGALSIINGKDDGSFDPEGFVTRAEMAKMIAVAMNGGKEPNFGTKTTPSFTDVKGHWAETFIEYCYDMKIINGRGDGTFDPAGNVTGVEAAKMVLSALGYDAKAYLLTGPEWDSNVNKNATQVCKPSLYDTLENVVMAQPITRDVAAQIIWNGLQNNTVTVSPDTVVSSGEVTNKYKNDGKPFLEVHYGANIGYAWLVGNSNTHTSLPDGSIALDHFYLDSATESQVNSALGTSSICSFPYDTDLSLIGEKVKVIFKDGKQGRPDRPDKNDTIYGVFSAEETEVVTATVADLGKVETNNKYVLKIDGTEYDVDTTNGVKVVRNYRMGAAITTYSKTSNIHSTTDDLKCQANGSWLYQDLTAATGDTIKAVMNDDGKISTIYVVSTTLQQVTAVSSDKVTISNVGTIKKADHDIYEGIAKDDVVTVTTLYATPATADDAFVVVEKAEVITGNVDKFKDRESVTVDGTVYKIYGEANLTAVTGGDWLAAVEKDDHSSNNIGDEVELYMVNGRVGAIKLVSEEASNYSVVMAVRNNTTAENIFDDLKLQVMGADGTKTIISVSDDSTRMDGTTVVDDDDFNKGDIVTYDMNKDGTATVHIKASAKTGSATAASSNDITGVGAIYNKSKKSVLWKESGDATATTYVTAADCVLFVDSGEGTVDTTGEKNSWKAYSIRNLGDISSSTRYAVVLDGDNKVVAVALRTATPAGAGSAKVYGIVSADNGTYKIDGTTYRQFVVNVNGEEYTVNQKRTSWQSAAGTGNQMAKGKIVGFEPTSDNIYEGINDFKVVTDGGQQGTANEWTYAVLVKEYNNDEGIITTFTGRDPKDAAGNTVAENATNIARYEGTGSYTYAVDDDVKMYFVDVDNDTAMESGSVSAMNVMTGYKSAYVVVDADNVVIAIIAEVSGEDNVTAID